ncbi:3-dehydroquinate synthase [soil metagenome]
MIAATVPIRLAGAPYDVVVGNDLLSSLGERCTALFPDRRRCALITDSTVGALYAPAVTAALGAAGIEPTPITVPAGETSKSFAQLEAVCRAMAEARLDRSAFAVALGGGVVGDLAGFAAAIFFRGIPVVQIPTSIVSQVDSSVGGKSGINIPAGKNLVGAFHQPALVLVDTDTLASLPPREYSEGFAEVIKHAAIRDAAMLPEIAFARDDRTHRAPLIARNIAIKARIVEEDERETSGTRALLNFGHTIGHGIEAAAGYGALLHGEAIALGTLAALHLSRQHAGLPQADADAVAAALAHFGLPTRLPASISTDTVMHLLMADKKFTAGQIRFVLLRSLGDPFVSSAITAEHIRSAVETLR